jgi:type VI secretion system protein
MPDRTLIERLEEATDDASPVQQRGSIDRYQASVLDNLRRILNARQGCCETRPDFGMPDLNDAIGQGADSVLVVARTVKQQIEMFEPRLKNVSVRFLADPENPLQLDFQISAVLQYEDQTERISFDTVLSDDKRFKVRG